MELLNQRKRVQAVARKIRAAFAGGCAVRLGPMSVRDLALVIRELRKLMGWRQEATTPPVAGSDPSTKRGYGRQQYNRKAVFHGMWGAESC